MQIKIKTFDQPVDGINLMYKDFNFTFQEYPYVSKLKVDKQARQDGKQQQVEVSLLCIVTLQHFKLKLRVQW